MYTFVKGQYFIKINNLLPRTDFTFIPVDARKLITVYFRNLTLLSERVEG
jgi:hypothetical protein